MNFAAEPQKRCEAGHYKGFGCAIGCFRHRFVQGGWRGLRSSSRVVQPLARLERGSRSNNSAIPRLFTNRTIGTPPSVVAANGACARKPHHPPSLTIEDSGIFNTATDTFRPVVLQNCVSETGYSGMPGVLNFRCSELGNCKYTANGL
jgi:hypothetical protein